MEATLDNRPAVIAYLDSCQGIEFATTDIINQYFVKAESWSLQHDDDSLLTRTYFQWADALHTQNELGNALGYALKAEGIAALRPRESFNLSNLLGIIHAQLGDYQEALSYHFQSLEQAAAIDPHLETYPLSNIAQIYNELEDIGSALTYAHKTVPHSQALPFPDQAYSLTYDYRLLANLHREQQRFDSAEYYLNLAITQAERLREEPRYPELQLIVSLTGLDLVLDPDYPDQVDRAPTFLATLQAADELVANMLKARYLTIIGKYDQVPSLLDTLHFEAAEPQIDLLGIKLAYYDSIRDYRHKSQVLEQLRELEQAQLDKQRSFANMISRVKYENRQALEEIAALRNEDSRQKKLFLGVAAGLVGVLIILLVRNLQRKQFNKRLENEVAEKTHSLQQAQTDLKEKNQQMLAKNEELEAVNYALSHDLQEPIRAIVSFSQLLGRGIPQDNRNQQYLSHLQTSARRLRTLLRDVQELNRIDQYEAQPQAVALGELVQAAADQLPERSGPQLTLLADGLPVLPIQMQAVKQILTHLLSNARLYNESVQPTVRVSYERRGDQHALLIQDNGIGIAEAYQEEVFRMLRRMHNQDQMPGSGLGLTIARKIAQHLGGDLKLEASRPGQGSTMVLLLPMHPPA